MVGLAAWGWRSKLLCAERVSEGASILYSFHPTPHINITMALFLGRLTPDTRSRDLEDLFAKYGRVTRLDIKRGTPLFVYFFLFYLHSLYGLLTA